MSYNIWTILLSNYHSIFFFSTKVLFASEKSNKHRPYLYDNNIYSLNQTLVAGQPNQLDDEIYY